MAEAFEFTAKKAGWNAVRTSPEMRACLESVARQVVATAEGLSESGKARYTHDVEVERNKFGDRRLAAKVHADTSPGRGDENVTARSNLKHNSLVKGLANAHV